MNLLNNFSNCFSEIRSDLEWLTSHAIVGEALAELIDHNEKDAYGITADSRLMERNEHD